VKTIAEQQNELRRIWDEEFTPAERWVTRGVSWTLPIKELERRLTLDDPDYDLIGDLYPQIFAEDFSGMELAIIDCIGCDNMCHQATAEELDVRPGTMRRYAKTAAVKIRSARGRRWPEGSLLQTSRTGWIRAAMVVGFGALTGASELGLPNGGVRMWLAVLNDNNDKGAAAENQREGRRDLWSLGENWLENLDEILPGCYSTEYYLKTSAEQRKTVHRRMAEAVAARAGWGDQGARA